MAYVALGGGALAAVPRRASAVLRFRNAERMKLLLLLGSGISKCAGMPMVGDITAQVLSGEGVIRHTSEVFYRDGDSPNYGWLRPRAEAAIGLVNAVEPRISAYYGRPATYEELASMLSQIANAISFEYDNPALHPLVESLLAEGSWENGRELGHAAKEARDYIRDMVWQLLAKPPRVERLEWLARLCARHEVDVATLNHDLVIEETFERFGIDYSDGFRDRRGDLAFWNDDFEDTRVRLLKLHGSISWWGQTIRSEEWRGYVTARSLGADALHPRDESGVMGDYPHDLRPILLTGAFDKILDYETWVLPDQHFRFQEALRRASRILIVGYGFGDKAINTRLTRWLAMSRENSLVVAHGKPAELREQARPAVGGSWDRWKEAGRLRVVERWAEELEADEIERVLAL